MKKATAVAKKPRVEAPATGLDAKKRKAVATALTEVLADTMMLQVKTQVFHWNVVGPNFYSLHKLTEEHYEDLFAAVDELAERVRSLGHVAPINLTRLVEESVISDEGSLRDVVAMIEQLISDHEELTSRARDCAKTAEDADDFSSHDLLVKRLTFHEKAIWMLRAIAT